LYRRSLVITRKRLGPNHREVAIRLQNLAWLHFRMRAYDQVEDECLKSLEIWKKNDLNCHY